MIQNEIQIVRFLQIPSIPKKRWDGSKSFRTGCAVTQLSGGGESYAVATFDKETDNEPRIIKVFAEDAYVGYTDIFVVPEYMEDIDIEDADLDDESKKKLELLKDEVKEMETEPTIEEIVEEEKGGNEYYFNNIENDEQARAFIRAYNKKHKIRAKVPQSHDDLVMRLSVIYTQENK
jgi:hypothetical protein